MTLSTTPPAAPPAPPPILRRCGGCDWWRDGDVVADYGRCLAGGSSQHRTAIACPEWQRRRLERSIH